MMIDSEDTTQTLALTESQAFSEAVHPHYDDDLASSAEDDDNSHPNDLGATIFHDSNNNNGQQRPPWRHGTPFRVHHRSSQGHDSSSSRVEPSTPSDHGLRITAPARLFYTQEATEAPGNDENHQPASPYQHQYSERALAAQERRQLRRQRHAREEAAFYDAQEAIKEFEQYRKISSQEDVSARIQAYRALCGYDETVAAKNVTPLIKRRLPKKGWYVANTNIASSISHSISHSFRFFICLA
jgi:hypothetical protein